MHRQQPGRDDDQALAVTVGLLLLIGGVLLVSCWTSPPVAFAVAAVPIAATYAAPPFTRRLAARRAVRRLLRSLPTR